MKQSALVKTEHRSFSPEMTKSVRIAIRRKFPRRLSQTNAIRSVDGRPGANANNIFNSSHKINKSVSLVFYHASVFMQKK